MSTSTAPGTQTPPDRPPSWLERLRADYNEDHKHPVNHVLHVWVGWPICAAGVLMLPFHPLWTVYAFVLGYAFMWTGHFVFERNLPTVFRHPTTPIVMAWSVVRDLGRGLARLSTPRRPR